MNILITLPSPTSEKQAIITGFVKKLGLPHQSNVRAYIRQTGVLVANQKTDINGFYKLYVPPGCYTLVAIDPNRKFNAVIQDNVVPK
ncbi:MULTISPECIES: hypothetical protein [unclassified Acinetobacter]|uniref:hypothetical protein n=1 Tax=unclassified Acinetobacter TaxID=196816 RepID=UPI0015D3DF35|nr:MULTISPECIES: hypothetical protein [unclassified Acinetobacter]